MTVPRDRVSFGYHVFPFSGSSTAGGETPPLALLPLRLRAKGEPWSTPFDAAIDTGSTKTVIPREVAEALRLEVLEGLVELEVPGGALPTQPAPVDLAIVDANYPEVPVWEIANTTGLVPKSPSVMAIPVVGWDILSRFHFCLDHRRARFEMRLNHE